MKKILIGIVGSIVLFIGGCFITPTVDNINIISYSIGATTGTVVCQTKMDSNTYTNIINIMSIVDTITPTTNTFVETWKPIVDEELQKLLNDDKIDILNSSVIRTGVLFAAEGIDYMFKKHPSWRLDLTKPAIHGFISGYMDILNEINCTKSNGQIVIDKDSYIYLSRLY